MRFPTASVIALAAASSALAQVSPGQINGEVLSLLSPTCQAAILELIIPTSPLYSCGRIDVIMGIAMSNSSIVPGLDMYASDICYTTPPCSASALSNASALIIAGCSSDLAKVGISNTTLTSIVDLYPLAREVFCLKTNEPFSGANATIPIANSTYNSTNGTFCVTSLLTEVSAYTGANLTNTFLDTIVAGGNTTALELLEMTPRTALCSDCIFAALDLIEEAYPVTGLIKLGSNLTVNQYVDGTCNATSYSVTTNGTLPSTIEVVAINSTYPLNITENNVTYAPNAGTTPLPNITSFLNATQMSEVSSVVANSTAMKKRWLGQA